MIEIDKVNKSFDQVPAVVDFSLQIEKNSIVGLIGPNGAGKTSLLRILATLYKPDSGSVRIGEFDLKTQALQVRPHLGFMPNEFPQFGDLTIREYLEFFGLSAGVPWKSLKTRVEEILELTELTARADQLVTAGSTGIKQRACLAKTLIHNPEVLILDEPASGLDPRARIEIRELLKELRLLNKTILLSSHILADLQEVCTHFAFMESGRLIGYGRAEELLEKKSATLTYRIEVAPADEARLKAGLMGREGLSVTLVKEGVLEVGSSGWSRNELLQKVLEMEIEVLSFGKVKNNLEDIFLQMMGQTS